MIWFLEGQSSQREVILGAREALPAGVTIYAPRPAGRPMNYYEQNFPLPDGFTDRILVIRAMHNIMRAGTADTEMRAMRELLKDDGLIGVVQHRAKADAPWSYANGTKGYMKQQDVIDFMRLNGFELLASSEINANPKDTADHPEGVWEMPPTLATKR